MTKTTPLHAEMTTAAAQPVRSRMIERLALSVAALGLAFGIGSLVRDLPEAYAEGRLSEARLSRLFEPSDGLTGTALAQRSPDAPKLEAEALPPATP